jgi:ribose/xylose/arabinose/galactoside ABC-type transport system permease subunit
MSMLDLRLRIGMVRRRAWPALAVDRRTLAVWVMLVLVLAVGCAVSPSFRAPGNLLNIAQQSAVLGMVSIGQFLVVLTGGIDLSVGSVAKLSGLVAAAIMDGHDGLLIPAVLACLAIGLVVGAVNAALVTRVGVAPFIATFAAYYVVRGLAFGFSTHPVGAASPTLYDLYSTTFAGVPVVVLALAAVWLGFWYLLQRRPVGRHVYAVGGDEAVARLSGVRVGRVLAFVYVACSVLAALSAVVQLMRLGVGEPRSGEGLELDAITAVVIGGASLFGGRGRLVGVLGGVLLLGAVNNMLDLLQVDSRYQQLIKGLFIMGAVALYRQRGRR